VRVAVGRDYSDVPPTRGVYKGEAESELSVVVTVLPVDAQNRKRCPDHGNPVEVPQTQKVNAESEQQQQQQQQQ